MKKKIGIKKFIEAISELSKQNFITKEQLIEIIQEIIERTFYDKLDPEAELEFKINLDKKILKLINKKKIVVNDEDYDPQYSAIFVKLSDAKKQDHNIKVDDTFTAEVDFMNLPKKISDHIKQLITQKIRELRKKNVYEKYKDKKGAVMEAKVVSSSKSNAIFEFEDGTQVYMPNKFKNPKINLKIGSFAKVYIEEIIKDAKGFQIIVSNGSKKIVEDLIKLNIPEVQEGIIEIMSISRWPGVKTKIAVKSNDENIDPIGTIIGPQGSRIKLIINKLDDEKIDVIKWSNNMNEYIANALSPVKVISILNKENENGLIEGHKIIVIPNKQQTLAIGKFGSNAKLIVELLGLRLDILSIDSAKKANLKIEWNGNIKDEKELQIIERSDIYGNNYNKNNSNNNQQFKSIGLEMDAFNQNILDEETSDNSHDKSNSLNEENDNILDKKDFDFSDDDIDPDFFE